MIMLLVSSLISSCQSSDEPATGASELPQESKIVTPAQDDHKVLIGSPVQVQTAYNQPVSKVELWIQSENEATEKLIRADTPDKGIVIQEWLPQHVGHYMIKVRAWDEQNQALADMTRQVEIVESPAIAAAPEMMEEPSDLGEAASFSNQMASPTPTPPHSDAVLEMDAAAGSGGGDQSAAAATPSAASDVEITVVQNVVPSPTAIPNYPPPPPVPGVPPGPTQEELNNFGPPICNAAEYEGVFHSNTARRIMITEPDGVPAQTVGGTVVHRAWRLRNIGTCTWGPGYELAFYGGNAMGSGGVAFESAFPNEPARRNVVIDRERLVMAEGKPNQTAVVELLLNAPTTPGIHQSYWRMRDPHGVFFGPIVGVTMDVVRECEFGVYGAPVINRFRVLIAGNVYEPQNPIRVSAELGDPITLDWSIINATNFDIVAESPTGQIESTSTTNNTDRAVFTVRELGEYIITLYADNGSCTVSQEVVIDVDPPYRDRFILDIIVPPGGAIRSAAQVNNLSTSSTLASNEVKAEWNHFDSEVDDFRLAAEVYAENSYTYCPGVNSILGSKWHCYTTSEWQKVDTIVKDVGNAAQGAATISNVEQQICNRLGPGTNYRIEYRLEAYKNGVLADPPESNVVEYPPYGEAASCPSTGLRTEIE